MVHTFVGLSASTQILFETFNVPAMYIAIQAVSVYHFRTLMALCWTRALFSLYCSRMLIQ